MAQTQPVPEIHTNARRAVLRDPKVQREAARLRLVTDERQGKNSPQWVRQLAHVDASRAESNAPR